MTYTNEEYEMLKANTKQIENYLRNLIPNVRDSIKIPFGEMVNRGRYGEVREPEFELVVRPDLCYGWSGGLKMVFDEAEVAQGSSGSRAWIYGRGFGARFMAALIENWFDIKCRMNTAISEQEKHISAIKNFQL